MDKNIKVLKKLADNFIRLLLLLRYKYLKGNEFMYVLSIITGVIAGLLAVLIKNTVHLLSTAVLGAKVFDGLLLYLSPIVGISLTVFIARRIMKVQTGHGIPKVLFAISRKDAALSKKNILSSSLFSALTVGFGGSAGLEGPSASAGAAIGSKIGRLVGLKYKQLVVLLGCGSTAAIAAIFNTPIAAILFSIEILMLDLSVISIIPLLISSVTGLAVSYILLEEATIYQYTGETLFAAAHIPVYVILGVLASINAVFFSKVYLWTERIFEKINLPWQRIAIGGGLLFILFFLFPSLYGEGYFVINKCIAGDFSFATGSPLFSSVTNPTYLALLLLGIIIFKTIATNVTFGMGGVGGIFAPSLFIGAVTGLFSIYILRMLGFTDLPVAAVVLVSMAGFMTGILHAPLTSIFLIAEITRGYDLMAPLIITSIVSFLISRKIMGNSVYTYELAKRNQLITHNKNKSVLDKINLLEILETDFVCLHPTQTIHDIIDAVRNSPRNVFPVTDDEGLMVGIFTLDDAKNYIFSVDNNAELRVADIMYKPATYVMVNDSIEHIARKIHSSGRYNIPVLDEGKYLGFISRARLFSKYQHELERISMDDE